MNNEEILKENNSKRFDIILSNPPYSNKLHLQFLEKYCQIAKNIISIQPADWIFKNGKDKIKSHIKDLDYYKYLSSYDLIYSLSKFLHSSYSYNINIDFSSKHL